MTKSILCVIDSLITSHQHVWSRMSSQSVICWCNQVPNHVINRQILFWWLFWWESIEEKTDESPSHASWIVSYFHTASINRVIKSLLTTPNKWLHSKWTWITSRRGEGWSLILLLFGYLSSWVIKKIIFVLLYTWNLFVIMQRFVLFVSRRRKVDID